MQKIHVIRADEAYSLEEFKRLTRQGDAAIRSARRNGLPVRKHGRQSFVLGADWLTYLRDDAEVVR